MSGTLQTLPLDRIRVDARAQPRGNMSTDVLQAYAEDMKRGDQFPPLTVFHDGDAYWCGDGFHRHHAARSAGLTEFPCEVREGGLRDAILHSCSVNAAHGHRRCNADKKRAVERLLTDDEWRQWSDREIARRCLVSHEFVGKVRRAVEAVTVNVDSETTVAPQAEARTYTTRHGTTATMNTANIGRRVELEPATQTEAKVTPATHPSPAVIEPPDPYDAESQLAELQRGFDAADEPTRRRFLDWVARQRGLKLIAIPTPSRKKVADAEATDGDDYGFEVFYSQYPRKVGRDAAEKAYRARVLKGGIDPADILAGALRFAEEVADVETQFIPHPATWLNEGRWKDAAGANRREPKRDDRPVSAARSLWSET